MICQYGLVGLQPACAIGETILNAMMSRRILKMAQLTSGKMGIAKIAPTEGKWLTALFVDTGKSRKGN